MDEVIVDLLDEEDLENLKLLCSADCVNTPSWLSASEVHAVRIDTYNPHPACRNKCRITC